MNCYLCEKALKPGGTRYGIRPAVGICQHCGIGVCIEHSHRDKELGAPLLCNACAKLAHSGQSQPSHEQELFHPAHDR